MTTTTNQTTNQTANNTFSILDFQQAVDLFNTVAGNSSKYNTEALSNQQRLVSEEAHYEALEAFKEDNAVKLLDACIDGLYVLLGQLQKLQAAGFDVHGAMQQVAEDNLSKFPTEQQVAVDSCKKYEKEGIKASYKYSCGRYVVYNTETGKVLKPVTFKSTDLSEYCPVKKISEIK